MTDHGKDVRIVFYKRRILYICPGCGKPIQFLKKSQGKNSCVHCGQKLLWDQLDNLKAETIQAEDGREAALIAEGYFNSNGMTENDWFNLDEWRRSLHGKGCEIYMIFKGPKEYGRFKRCMNGGKRK